MLSVTLFSDAFIAAPIIYLFQKTEWKHCSQNGHEYDSMAESIWFCFLIFWMDKLSEFQGNNPFNFAHEYSGWINYQISKAI